MVYCWCDSITRDREIIGGNMDNFDICINYILESEGGLVDNKYDAGGITKYGISLRAYKNIYPKATRETIINLTKEDAIRFYNSFFWLQCGAESVDLPVALVLFDISVNCGQETAVKLLQRALGVNDDGIIGNKTLAAIRASKWQTLLCNLNVRRLLYYFEICTPKETDTPTIRDKKEIRRNNFLRGWLNRSEKTFLNAIKLGKK